MGVCSRIRPGLAIAATAVAFVLGIVSPSPAADESKPKNKNTREKFVPPEAKFKASATPVKVKPGGTVTYSVTATLAPTWHIYAFYPKAPAAQLTGVATEFDFFQTDGLVPVGVWTADKAATAGDMSLDYHEGMVIWTLKLKVPADAGAGRKTLRNQIHYMICDPNSCKPDAYVTLPDVTITVAPDGEALLSPDEQAAMVASLIATEVSPSAAKPPAKPSGEAAEMADRGMVPFLLWCAGGGLLAVLMPCVWPMIPITVNFFVKQGEANKGNSIKLAVAYCLAIIGIFTGLGLVVTVVMGSGGTQDLGNNPWINLIMGVAFIAMGLMLLGLFEVRLPSFLLNVTSQNEGRGGWVGVMFMAATLTITSFTCTAPVVGSLLGQAVQGQRLYPVLGMLTFSAVLSLPFFVLALVPSLLKTMPRSGDWMNAVKVVGGLVEIAFAFKFLNTAEINFGTNPADCWIDAGVILTAWVVAALVCGIYLLGLFRTDHDGDVVKVGPMRLITGMLFLGVALYLAPALFGNPPKSRFYGQIAGLLPRDASKFDDEKKENVAKLDAIVAQLDALKAGGIAVAKGGGDAQSGVGLPRKTKNLDPKQAIREEKILHGVIWGLSYDDALAEAKKTGKPVLIDFTGVNCANCRTVERAIFPRKDVIEEMKKFVTVALYTDSVPIEVLAKDVQRDLADDNKEREFDLTRETTSPLYVVVNPEGKVVAKTGYNSDPDFLVRFLKEAQGKYQPPAEKVAEGGGAR